MSACLPQAIRKHVCSRTDSRTQVVRAERARVGVDYVLGVGGFDLERVEEEVCSRRGLGPGRSFTIGVGLWAGDVRGWYMFVTSWTEDGLRIDA